MKPFFRPLLFFLSLFLLRNGLSACPTCLGRISDQSPVFFSDEAYKSDVFSGWQIPEDILVLENDDFDDSQDS